MEDREVAGESAVADMRGYFSVEEKAELAQKLEAFAAIGTEVKRNILEAQTRQKEQFDKSHKPADAALGVGKRVMLEAAASAFPGLNRNLARRWKGPYIIKQERGDVNRLIQHEKNAEDVQEVHIARLKPYFWRGDGVTYDVKEILQERLVEGSKLEYLVRLDGSTARGDRWIPEEEAARRAEPETLARFRARPEEERRSPLPKSRAPSTEAGLSKTALKKKAVEERRKLKEAEKAKKEEGARRAAREKEEEARRAKELARIREEAEAKLEAERREKRKEMAAARRAERAAKRTPVVVVPPALLHRPGRRRNPSGRRVTWSDGEVEVRPT